MPKFQEEAAKPDGFMEVRNIEKIKIEKNLELAVSQYNMHTSGMKDFRNIVGVNPDALGETSEIRSGVGVKAKVAMTDLIVAPVFDNTKRTRVCLAKTVLELVKLYYTEGKILAITDDLKKTRSVKLNKEQVASTKQGIYDVIEEDAPDITTLQQEQFALLLQYLPQIIPLGPFWSKKRGQGSGLAIKHHLLALTV